MRQSVGYSLVALALLTWVSASARVVAGQAPAPAVPAQPSRELIDRYCVTCHNDRLKTAGLSLQALSMDEVAQHADVWEKVVRKLRGRLMPPVGMPRPETAVIDAFASSLESTLDRAAAAQPDPGAVVLHRLNRTEYGNAIRDVLDLVDTDVAAMLPSDDDSDGFDNIASVLKESPAFLEGYVSAAREAARLALGDASGPPSVSVYRAGTGAAQRLHVEGMPLGTRGGILVKRYFPVDGEYKFDLTLRQSQIYINGLEFPHDLVMLIDGAVVFTQTIGGEADARAQDQQLATGADAIQARLKNLRLPVTAGPHTVIVTFRQRTFARSLEVLQPFAGTTRDHHPSGWMNGIPVLEKMEVMGPMKITGPGDTASRRRILSCTPSITVTEVACARTILGALARRAYRRAVTDTDLATPMAFFDAGAKAGGFEAGIQRALTYILASPNFLYRAERDPESAVAGSVRRISPVEMASRLSFFLWSTVPDEELLRVATSRTVSDPLVVERQVRRMLGDPKAQALVTNFFSQWLRLRELAVFDPSPQEFPDFDEDLRSAMRQELELFTGSIIGENRSVLDLLSARDTFLNERLAEHYGITGIRGQQFRRVTLDDGNRWGLLGKASLLTITSYGNRTSPVLRGRFVLETILGTPPSPPPPNVPSLKENEAGAEPKSVRELLEQHRSNPACASCHRLMDPLGFSLENYDSLGGWRGSDHGVPIDPSGTLFDGTAVSSPATLRQALMARPDQFVGTMTERMLTYALGRSLTPADMPVVRAIVRDVRANGYTFSAMVMAVVRSAPFQMRKAGA
ncbi:MAG: DUF1592 domain-containing protein [Vicinamibacterales bacterium]